MNTNPDCHPETPENGQQIYRLTITNNRGQVLTCQDFDSYDEAKSMKADIEPYYLEERQPGDKIESIIEKINLPKTCGNCKHYIPSTAFNGGYCHEHKLVKNRKNVCASCTPNDDACEAYTPTRQPNPVNGTKNTENELSPTENRK